MAASKTVNLKRITMIDKLKKTLVDFHKSCFIAHENAMNAFLVGDSHKAAKVKKMRETIEKSLGDFEKGARTQSINVPPHILAFTSTFRQTYEPSVDIADLLMPKKL